ncbi:hypothetical protein WN55_06854 [Dufourea novaeangliae]|uniref:Uncharacterized protein n=1 Tax=Dufourea novaeangliae TaxID=178035 RepID=A0A154P1X1_DUFNO|nr:hypothetical protein WN55_06854 [Dufourea novaeangliae]
MFFNHWVGRSSNIAWTACSPDLTPLDYFLWGTLKNKVYRELGTTAEDLRERIISACTATTAKKLEKVLRSLII